MECRQKYYIFVWALNSTALLWLSTSSRPPAFKRIISSDLVILGALMRVIITEQSLTPEPHLSPLVCHCSQVSNYRTAGSLLTHTFLIQLLLILTHTILPLPEEWVKENALSVCLPAERSIIYMDGDGQGGVFSLALSSTVWTLPFCPLYICLPSLVRPSLLHFSSQTLDS